MYYYPEPEQSPWGEVQHCRELCPGVFQVSTAGHGGIMARTERSVFSTAAKKYGVRESGYLCFEEDCAAAVTLRELLDKRLCKAPEHYTPEEYDNAVNGTIQRFYPEYWKARERAMAQAVFLPHREDIGR